MKNEELIKNIKKGDINNVKTLIDSGSVDLNMTTDDLNWSPLTHAIGSDRSDIAIFLIESGADIEHRTWLNTTPFILSCTKSNYKMAEFLLEHGADIDAKGNNNKTSLICASERINKETVSFLLIRGADINAQDDDNNTCLDYSCNGIWKEERFQELIINKQPHNIKLLDEKIGIIPSLRSKYKEIIELSEMGLL